MRPLGMPRDLHLLPRRQPRIGLRAAARSALLSSRPTSSAMLSSLSVERWRSSSILPSSSAIGRSKSRKCAASSAAAPRGWAVSTSRAQPLGSGHGYRSASSRYRRGPASAARCADRRRGRAGGWRRHGAAHAATASPGRDRRPSASSFSSWPMRCRVRCPARAARREQPARDLAHRAGSRRGIRGIRRAPAAPVRSAARPVPCRPCRAISRNARIAPRRGEPAGHQLGDAQAGRVEQLEDAAQPHPLVGPAIRGGADQALDSASRQDFGSGRPSRGVSSRAVGSSLPHAVEQQKADRTAASPKAAAPASAAPAPGARRSRDRRAAPPRRQPRGSGRARPGTRRDRTRSLR